MTQTTFLPQATTAIEQGGKTMDTIHITIQVKTIFLAVKTTIQTTIRTIILPRISKIMIITISSVPIQTTTIAYRVMTMEIISSMSTKAITRTTYSITIKISTKIIRITFLLAIIKAIDTTMEIYETVRTLFPHIISNL